MGLYESLNPVTGRSRGSISQIVEGLSSYIQNKRANERREEIRKLFEQPVQQVRPEVAANAQAVNQMGNIPVDMVNRQRQMQPQGAVGSLPMPSGSAAIDPRQTETTTRMRQYTPELAAQAASILEASPEQMVNMIFGAQQAEHARNKPMEVGRHGAIVTPGGEELYKNVDPYEGLDYELRKDTAGLRREQFEEGKKQFGEQMGLRRDQLTSIDRHRKAMEGLRAQVGDIFDVDDQGNLTMKPDATTNAIQRARVNINNNLATTRRLLAKAKEDSAFGLGDPDELASLQQNVNVLQQMFDALNPASRKSQGTSGTMPRVGDIEDGYRFKGGDPADPNAWEKVQ